MAANPIDLATFKRVLSLNVDGTRARRYSADPARRRHYAASRTQRYSRYLASLGR